MSETTADLAGSDEKVLQISKYPNRRYYDRTRGRHLTLEELHTAVRDGYEIRVTDSKTGADITVKVLAQIILELDPPKLGVFPVRLLHRLLQTNEELVGDFTRKYFSQALDAFIESQKKAELLVRQAMGLRPPGGGGGAAAGGDWAKVMWGPFHPAAWGGAAPTAAKDEKAAAVEQEASTREVEELRREVQDLRSRLRREGKSTPARRPKKTKSSSGSRPPAGRKP